MPGLVRGVVRTAAVAGTATAVSGRVQRRQQARWAQQDQGYAEPAQAAPPPVAGDDPIAKLKELGELRDSGVLTEEEFAAQKAKLLA
jgi:hypothetical protein